MKEKEIIEIDDLRFKKRFSAMQIEEKIVELANEINADYCDHEDIVVLVVLKGGLLFAADIMRHFHFDAQVEFVKLSSYDDMTSSGSPELAHFKDLDLHKKHIIILEDIVDTGQSILELLQFLRTQEPNSVTLTALFYKSNKAHEDLVVDYYGFDIPDYFIVGYGMDLREKGRLLSHVYTLEEE